MEVTSLSLPSIHLQSSQHQKVIIRRNINKITSVKVRVKLEHIHILVNSPYKLCRTFICRSTSTSRDVNTTVNLAKQKNKDVGFIEQPSLCVEEEDHTADCAFFLHECVKAKSVRQGKAVHARVIKTVFDTQIYLQNNVIAMYAKLNNLVNARQVFDRMPQPNVVSWTALISGYAKSECGDEDALRIFVQMLTSGVKPNEFTYMSVLGDCDLERGKQVQGHVIKTGFDSYVQVTNALVDMYVKCGILQDASHLFDTVPKADTITWNTMIAGYAQSGRSEDALETFSKMHQAGFKPDQCTFSSVLIAISTLSSMAGQIVHGHVVRTGFDSYITVNNALISMYARCGHIDCASTVFNKMPQRDVISWTSMITGYAQHGQVDKAFHLFQNMPKQNSVSYSAMIAGFAQNGEGGKALQLFRQMQQTGINSTNYTFGSVLNACADLATLKCGKQLHSHIIKAGMEACTIIGSALIDMYGKCWVVGDAYKVFDGMPEKNLVTWTGMITGYAQNGWGEEALNIFTEMQQEHVITDKFTLTSVLGACGTLGAMGEGKCFHAHILKSGLGLEVGIGNALVSMYVKCGCIEDAIIVFGGMQDRDVVSWNAMIIGFAQHGRGKEALQLFQEMQEAGMKLTSVTFVGVLAACKNLGLVEEGRYYFDSMSKDHGIAPSVKHYACMVDIFGRAGLLKEAENFINQIPCEPSALVWNSLIRACKIHCNVELAKRAAGNILGLEPEDPATYILMANIYASVGLWDGVEKVRLMMKDRGLKKLPARSWIFSKKRLHSFLVRDRVHPQIEDIRAKLDALIRQSKEAGYTPDTSIVLHDTEPHQKEHFVTNHSEKLAVAFGLLTAPPGTPIRVIKNIRVCEDCHTFTKFVTKIVGEEIILRDASCFHYFKDGYCLCGDYW